MLVEVATTPTLFDTKAVSVNPVLACGSIGLASLDWRRSPLPPPPPHAATAMAQATPSADEVDALLVMIRCKFIGALHDVKQN